MKENIEQMRERHKKEIEDIQSSCKHEEISKWMPYMWAPGHFGHNVKVCKFCGTIVEKDTRSEYTMCDHMGWPNPQDPCPCGFWKGDK